MSYAIGLWSVSVCPVADSNGTNHNGDKVLDVTSFSLEQVPYRRCNSMQAMVGSSATPAWCMQHWLRASSSSDAVEQQ
jgi:hypothetical protein